MFIADCPDWIRKLYPNLPAEHHDEYVLRLGEFIPNCPMKSLVSLQPVVRDCEGKRLYNWDFPFVMERDEAEAFDIDGFDQHTFKVEDFMIETYDNLTEESFCDF
jgi:hypothetical protein